MTVDSSVYQQLDYMAGQLTQMEERMAEQIDPREYGRLEATVEGLKRDVDAVKTDVQKLSEKVDVVIDKLSEAKGGWKLLMALGGAGATLGSALTWFFSHSIHIGPKG